MLSVKSLTLLCTICACLSGCASIRVTKEPSPEEIRFNEMDQGASWEESFFDAGTGTWENGSWMNGKWQEKWFLDGAIASVENEPGGMHLRAGPRYKDDAHHMVLWTKREFSGDLKIEYEFTRTDWEDRCVVILYVQSTGSGEAPYTEDVYEWRGLRSVPTMGKYFCNMNTYHISYATHCPSAGNGTVDYVRGRRYMPEGDTLRGTNLPNEYANSGLWKPYVPYKMTVIKNDREMVMRVVGPDKTSYFHFKNEDLPPITHGRIGLRHMFTRSAIYKNFRISTKPGP